MRNTPAEAWAAFARHNPIVARSVQRKLTEGERYALIRFVIVDVLASIDVDSLHVTYRGTGTSVPAVGHDAWVASTAPADAR